MKVLVFGGSGKIGSAVTWDLVQDKEVEEVGIVGRNAEALARTKKWVGSDKVVIHILDISKESAVKALMKKYDVGVLTLPDRGRSYQVIHYAVEAGLNIVDTLEE